MARPFKEKNIEFCPDVTYFKPAGIRLSSLEEVELSFEELEAMRLSEIEEVGQEMAAKKMGVHQSTFQRTLLRARQKVADALVNGKAIRICGGVYKMPGRNGTGPAGGAGRGFGRGAGGRGFGIGRGGGAFGAGGICICPDCGHEQPHVRGQPCNRIKCQKYMARK
ncbi:hypothetical protein COU37_01500 [Candidatus Micrarchaeota archaeon CG10_big_fil_rev_8_21_14_0_10_45_29]|nr:MAG: hypothetical protein COU37_01500 [Candidatus Micrarchaeota archaeon CG10_big_fil_rev_8_21_14_0_10_45_29]